MPNIGLTNKVLNGRWSFAFITILFLVATFWANNDVLFVDIMESRNIITAREMVYDGNWVMTTMNGEPRLEKPPLPTWIAAVSEMTSPGDIALQRAWAGVAAMLLVVFFHKLGKVLFGDRRVAVVSSLVLCTSYSMVLMGRTASWDIWCHCFMLGAIWQMVVALRDTNTTRWGSWIMAGVLTGLSVMSKGPVSLFALFLPFLIAYGIFCREKRGKLKSKSIAAPVVVMTIIALVVGGWWYLYVYLENAAQTAAVVAKESGSWVNRNVRPWYYYSTFFAETGVWALMTLTALLVPVWSKRMARPRPYLFSLAWMIAIVVILSLMPEKKNRYLLPMLIPAAYTVGAVLWQMYESLKNNAWGEKDKLVSRIFNVNAALLMVVIAAVPVAACVMFVAKVAISVFSAVLLAICMWTAAVIVWLGIKKRNPMYMLGGVVTVFVSVELLFFPLLGKMFMNPDYHSISEIRGRAEFNDVPFYSLKNDSLRIEIVYEAGRKIRPIEEKELAEKVPCVLVTLKSVDEALPAYVRKKVKCKEVGSFDSNRQPKSDRHYQDGLLYRATMIE